MSMSLNGVNMTMSLKLDGRDFPQSLGGGGNKDSQLSSSMLATACPWITGPCWNTDIINYYIGLVPCP